MRYPPVFWFPLGLPCSQVDPMAARKGDLVLYSGDLLPTEARKLPSCPRSHSVNRKGKPTHPSAPLVDAVVRFYEASKHSSLALINQEFCRHSNRLPVVSYTSCIVSHASYLFLKVKGQAWWGRSIQSAIFLARPISLMSSESHGVLTERTSCAIHAFLFL